MGQTMVLTLPVPQITGVCQSLEHTKEW